MTMPDIPQTDHQPTDPTLGWFHAERNTTHPGGALLESAADALKHIEESYSEPWPDAVRENATILTQAGLYPGIDFSVIPYIGRPRTASQNAENALRHGARGVELSAIAKSFAGTATVAWGNREPFDVNVVLTGPADLSFRTTDILPGQIGDLKLLDDEQLERLGFEHGTVSPVGALTPKPSEQVYYLFDRDFIDSSTRNPERRVYISGGDPGWSISLDIRKLITSAEMVAPSQAVRDICERGPDRDRVFASHDVTLISGDSPQVGARYYAALEATVRAGLQEAGAYYGDDSMPDLDLLSRRAMSPTGHVAAHHPEVAESVQTILKELPTSQRQRLIGFTSNAANLDWVAEPVKHGVRNRQDLRIVTANEAVVEYINTTKPASVIVVGLPDVMEQYPDQIGETPIAKSRGKIAEWMQTARSGSKAEVGSLADELKSLVAKTVKLAMADQQQLDGAEKGQFMRNPDIQLEGAALVAGTELWKILEVAGWQEGMPGLENIELIDPITLLMQHMAKLAIENPSQA